MVAAASTVMFAASAAAVANSRLCGELEVELASASQEPSPAQTRRYDVAIAKQRDHLRLARIESQRSGCAFSPFGQGPARCGAIQDRIGRMEQNLDALERRRAELAGSAGRSRAAILAALDANGCRDEGELSVRGVPDHGGEPLGQPYDGGIRTFSEPEEGQDAGENPEENAVRVRRTLRPDGVLGPEFFADAQPKEFRTLCVRTCDGYVFPMSAAASRSDFARDLENCQAACPGAEVQVYYHRRDGEESDDMVSAAAGSPYAELPTAWLYKRAGARPQGCGCSRPPSNFEVIAGNPRPAAAQPEPAAELPVAQPAPRPAGPSPGSGRRKVRVVGPVFLPGPVESSDLRVPARKEVR